MHELTAREIFQETGRRFLHSDGRCASLTTPVPRFTTSGFRLRIATSSSAGLVAVLFLLRANIGPEALYTSRSLTNLSGTLSPTLRVEIVGEAHRTVVGDIFDKIGGSLDAHCPRAVRNRDLGLLEDTHSAPSPANLQHKVHARPELRRNCEPPGQATSVGCKTFRRFGRPPNSLHSFDLRFI